MNVRRSWPSLLLVALLLVLGVAPVGATGGSAWTPPENLSDWQQTLDTYRLEAGADGTLALVWPSVAPGASQRHLHARVREPGAPWGPDEDLSGQVMVSVFVGEIRYWGAKVAPDGTVWVAWAEIDDTQPAGNDNRRVMVAHRPRGGAWQTDWVSFDPLFGNGYETEIRSTDLAVGPEGDVAVAWVACTTGPSTPSQGPCALNVRRRLPGAADWKDIERVDPPPSSQPDMGIERAYVLVGSGGLTVVVWAEANPANPSEWVVRAARWASRTAGWQRDDDVSDGWFTPLHHLVQPVMGEDGMVVTAWTVMTQAPTAYVHYSATLSRPGGLGWGTPAQISLPSSNYEMGPRLSLRGGVTVAAWEQWDASGQMAIYANARDAGGTWNPSAAKQVSKTFLSAAEIQDLEQWPGGTAVVLWSVVDGARAANKDSAVVWSGRPPGGDWGDAGQGQFGDWGPWVNGALALSEDGSGVVLWATEDSSLPPNEQAILLAATWPPGGPDWSPPEVVDSVRRFVWLYDTGLVTVPGGRSVAAAWGVYHPSNNDSALFFSERIHRVYLPLLLRNAP